jgi:hypothetical protein
MSLNLVSPNKAWKPSGLTVAGGGPANTTAGFVPSGVVAPDVNALGATESAGAALAVVVVAGVALAVVVLAGVVLAVVVLVVVVLEGVFWPAAFLAAFCATASRTLSASMKRPDASSSFFAVIAHGAPPGPTAT